MKFVVRSEFLLGGLLNRRGSAIKRAKKALQYLNFDAVYGFPGAVIISCVRLYGPNYEQDIVRG
jgi:hypothetical protein